MALLNLMEDIVRNTVDEIIRNDKDLAGDTVAVDDVIAYVLNRIPPRYVTSERGVIHGKLATRFAIQQRSDILFLSYEAITLFRRRETESSTGLGSANPIHLRFPHVIGEVLEETSLSVIPNVEIALKYNGAVAGMVDVDWKNPYYTTSATMGYFHFWPAYQPDSMPEGGSVTFQVEFNHDQCESRTLEIEIPLLSGSADMGSSFRIPLFLLTANEGAQE